MQGMSVTQKLAMKHQGPQDWPFEDFSVRDFKKEEISMVYQRYAGVDLEKIKCHSSKAVVGTAVDYLARYYMTGHIEEFRRTVVQSISEGADAEYLNRLISCFTREQDPCIWYERDSFCSAEIVQAAIVLCLYENWWRYAWKSGRSEETKKTKLFDNRVYGTGQVDASTVLYVKILVERTLCCLYSKLPKDGLVTSGLSVMLPVTESEVTVGSLDYIVGDTLYDLKAGKTYMGRKFILQALMYYWMGRLNPETHDIFMSIKQIGVIEPYWNHVRYCKLGSVPLVVQKIVLYDKLGLDLACIPMAYRNRKDKSYPSKYGY